MESNIAQSYGVATHSATSFEYPDAIPSGPEFGAEAEASQRTTLPIYLLTPINTSPDERVFVIGYNAAMRTAVLLSGGVDSSVALNLLVRSGAEVAAFYLKIWLEDEVSYLGSCPWEEDLTFARSVCDQAKVKLEVVSLQREYHELVVSYTLDELQKGGTPSPDLFCNRLVKFGAFWDRVGGGWDRVATGHYARVVEGEGDKLLYRNRDPIKDQTYFLSRLTQDQLRRTDFPLGPFLKSEVRRLAEGWQLPNRNRPDSQGICFLGKIPYRNFVKHYLGEKPGTTVEARTGKILGTHRGLWFYTLGQRSGLGLSGGPWYVSGKKIQENVLELTHQSHLADAQQNSLVIGDLHWLGPEPQAREPLLAKLRHGPQLLPARLEYKTSEKSGPGSLARVVLGAADTGLAPGQFCVLYRGENCLGSGRITGVG